MARSMYQYETSPRKIQPEYTPKKRPNKAKKQKKVMEQQELEELEQKKQRKLELKKAKRVHHRNIAVIVGMFLILLTISYRNSLITEKFKEIQSKKNQLSAIQKTNEQAEVSIESSLNLKNLEKSAKKKLGMQKLDNDQKVYVALPKEDYIESAVEEIQEESNTNWLKNLIEKILE